MMINSIKELSDYLGSAHSTEKSVGRRLFKDTECGIVFGLTDTGVVVYGYAEGSDAECQGHYLNWPFPSSHFDELVKLADLEGCNLWDEWNEYRLPLVPYRRSL